MSQKKAKGRSSMSRRMALAESERRRQRRRKLLVRAGQIGIPVVVLGVALIVVLLLVGNGDGEGDAGAVTDVTRETIPTTTQPPVTRQISSCDEVSPTVGGDPELAEPAERLDANTSYTAVIETDRGTIRAELSPEEAPIGVANFVFLARCGYYDNTPVTRIAKNFVIQMGDPTGTRGGGPGYRIPDEPPPAPGYETGALAYANSGPNTTGSQFFIVTGDATQLPNSYTEFGFVVDGLEVAKEIEQLDAEPDQSGQPAQDGPPAEPVTVISVTIEEG